MGPSAAVYVRVCVPPCVTLSTVFTRYPYVLYLIPLQLSDDMLLVSMLYPCQAFLVLFNGWLLYKTWPRGTRTATAPTATTLNHRKVVAITAGH